MMDFANVVNMKLLFDRRSGIKEPNININLKNGGDMKEMLSDDNKMDDTRELALRKASILIKDALNGRIGFHLLNEENIKYYEIMTSLWYKYLVQIFVSFMHLILIFFERPTSHDASLEHPWVQIIEIIILLIYIVDSFILYSALKTSFGIKQYLSLKSLLRIFAIIVLMIFNIISLINERDTIQEYIRILRAIFIVTYIESLNNALRLIIIAIIKSLRLFVLIGFYLLFSASIAFIMYSKQANDTNHSFDSFTESLYSLFLFLIGSDFPRIMLNGLYEANNWNALFFVIYFIFGVLVLMNMLLAMISTAFSTHTKYLVHLRVRYSTLTLAQAYYTICQTPYQLPNIDHDKTYFQIFLRYFSVPTVKDINDQIQDIELADFTNEKSSNNILVQSKNDGNSKINYEAWKYICKYIRDWDDIIISSVWKSLDKNENNILDLEEFLSIVPFLTADINIQYENENTQDSQLKLMVDSVWLKFCYVCHQILSYRPNSDWSISLFEMVVDFVVTINVIFILIDVSESTSAAIPYNLINSICVIIYVIELIIKLSALGMKNYFKVHINRLDFVIVIIALVESIIIMTGGSPNSFPNSLRLLRLFRWVRLLQVFNITFQALFSVFHPSFGGLIGILLIIFYVYGILGVALFRNKLSPTSASVINSDYFKNGWGGLNFDTFGNALMTCFIALASTSNWITIMNAVTDVTTGVAARIYFISFTLIVAIIVVSLVTSYMLDAFFWYYRQAHSANDDNNSVVLGGEEVDEEELKWPRQDNDKKRRVTVTVDYSRTDNSIIRKVFGDDKAKKFRGINI